VSRSINIPGEVEPSEFSSLSAPYNARLNSLVDEGKKVKKGDELARIDVGDREQKLSDEIVQIEKKKEELKLLKEKFINESSRLKSLEKIKRGALKVAQLEYEALLKQRDEDKIINLKKALELKKAKLELASQKFAHVKELNKKGLRSDLEVLETKLEISTVKKEMEIEAYKLDLEESGPTKNNIKLAQLNAEMAQLELEKAQLECETGLKKGNFDIELNKEELVSRELTRDQIQNEIDQAALKASRDGIVILLDTYISGEKRKAKVGDSIYGMIPLIQVADDSSLVIKCQVSEMDIKFFKIGMKAVVKTKSAPGREFGARVKKIGRIATQNLSERQDSIVEVFFDLKSPENSKIDPVFSPGASCEVEIQLYNVDSALWVPSGYVIPDVIEPGVITANGSFKPVKIDFSDGLNGYVILDGLKEGEIICLPGGVHD
jgi:HlyD family secretion protein